jgi:hypothetical protein
MSKIKNSDLLNRVLTTLITITARRSSEAIACAFMDAIIKTLKEKYGFLKYITIKNMTYYEENAIYTEPEINAVKPEFVGQAVESIIRILCMDLEEESGLFFIKELKDRLGETYIMEFKKYGVDLDLLKLEQKHLHEQLEKKRSMLQHGPETETKDVQAHILEYTWESVSSFKYRNNVCFLYDKNGKLLDKLHLNEIIEYYIRTLTDFGKLVKKSDDLEITVKEIEFLDMLYSRDMDEESAKFLLNIGEADFEHMIQRLLRYEFLQYVSDDEIKITDKGIAFLDEKKKLQNPAIILTEQNKQP